MSVTLNASTSSGLVSTADTSGTIELQSNGTTKLSVLSTGVSGTIVQGTAVASTSGTSIDFTSIPSWVKKITVMFSGVSTSGTSNILIQLGAGSVTSSGYISYGMNFGSASGSGTSSTAGFLVRTSSASEISSGLYTIATLGSNAWSMQGMIGSSNNSNGFITCGGLTLGGTLDRVRITTAGGTDTFDAGSINILYEG